MKKLIFCTLCLIISALMFSCGTPKEEPKTTTPVSDAAGETDTPAQTETKPQKTPLPNSADYDYFHVFEAPEGNPRDIVMDHMLEMSKIQWTAAEGWTTTWKGDADFKVSLTYEKGKTYYGIPYGRSNATLDEFSLFVTKDKTFTPNSPYYEEIVGNHCSSSMVMAFQQVLDIPYAGGLSPIRSRSQYVAFPEGIEIPPSRSSNPDDWISATVFSHNGQDAIYNGYAQLDKGDILYKKIDGSGHTRMVSKVEIYNSVSGKLMPNRSYVYCVEQTNAWADNKRESTWFIDRKYTFSELYSTLFMPITLNMYHDEDFVIEDAYIAMKGKNTPESLPKMLNGTIESNFPLAYARMLVTDKDGNVVCEHLEYYMTKSYKLNLRNLSFKLGIDKLEAGEYTFNLRAGIARGGVELENIKFTVK